MVPVWQDESPQNFLQRGDVQRIFMQKFFQVLQTHQCCPHNNNQKQQTNQWETKTEKTTPSTLKLIPPPKKKYNINIKQKLQERYFLTPHLTHLSLKTQYVQSPFCCWAFAGGHTSKAIHLPGNTQSPRESIEVRMIAFFTGKKETAAVAADLGSLTKAVCSLGVSCDWMCVSGWPFFL